MRHSNVKILISIEERFAKQLDTLAADMERSVSEVIESAVFLYHHRWLKDYAEERAPLNPNDPTSMTNRQLCNWIFRSRREEEAAERAKASDEVRGGESKR